MASPFSPYDEMTDAEEAVTAAFDAEQAAGRRLIRLTRLLADGETHRPGRREDLLAEIGAARREHEEARARFDHALCAFIGEDMPPIADATPAHVERAMTARLRNNLSLRAVKVRQAGQPVPVLALPVPSTLLPQTHSPAAA